MNELSYRLLNAPIGAFITFEKEKRPYRVRARSGRFFICTRPYPQKKTTYYTIVDLVEKTRGPENLIFGMGAESDQDCWDMVDRLDGRDNNHPQGRDAIEKPKFEAEMKKLGEKFGFQQSFRTEVSSRHGIDLDVVSVRIPKSCKPF